MSKIIKRNGKEYLKLNYWETFVYNLENIPYLGGIVRIFTGTIQDP